MSPESQNVEYKQAWHDEYLKWACGFANAQGGRIFIGRDDAGRVVGLRNAKKLLEDLPNKFRDCLGLMPSVNLHEEAGKAFLEVIVEPSTVPISLRGAYYWRSGSVKQELKGHALNEFLFKKMGVTWDRMVESKASLADIDEAEVERFKKKAAMSGRLPDLSSLSTEALLRKLRLLTDEGLTNAALVLFGEDPGAFYPNLFVKIGRFGLSVVDMRFQEVCEGNLFQMLHDVMEQLEKKFLIKPVRFEGLRRIEELEYPVAALREMLLNALVHRNYMGSMTQLKVMDDRIILWNAGALPLELSVEKLFQGHESFPRNPLIADVCYKAGYIDSWGRGVEKIAEACKQAGLLPPLILERSGGIAVEILKTPLDYRAAVEEDNAPPHRRRRTGVGNASVEMLVQTPVQISVETEILILETCRETPSITIPEMAERIGLTERTIQRWIQKLRTKGCLRRIGGRKNGYWEVVE